VIGLVSGTVSGAVRQTGHLISFIVTLVMMIAIVSYTAYHARTRDTPQWNKYGPTVLTALSSLLVLAEPTRHLFVDHAIWPGGAAYRDSCESESVACLTPVGWGFEIMTWSGFTILMIGTLWNANIMDKIRELRWRWQEIRQQSQEQEQEEELVPDAADASDQPAS